MVCGEWAASNHARRRLRERRVKIVRCRTLVSHPPVLPPEPGPSKKGATERCDGQVIIAGTSEIARDVHACARFKGVTEMCDGQVTGYFRGNVGDRARCACMCSL